MILFLLSHSLKDCQQLIFIIVIYLKLVSETAGKTWVYLHKLLHLILISSGNHNKLTTIVLHSFHQGVDSFLTIHITSITEGIGLINE